MQQPKIIICCVIALCMLTRTEAQGFLKKMKQKVEQTADKVIDKKVNDATGTTDASQNSNNQNGNATNASQNSSRTRSGNKGGEGLVSTPPNVNENLDGAETSFKGGKYSDARYNIQQAMLGVEMEIGKKILAGLPNTIETLTKDSTLDQVTSTGWGWAGLTIKREYFKDDQELKFTIANNSAYMQAINMYLTNSGYMQTSGGEQKWKQVKVQDEKAVIEYDQRSGYKLSIPLGQSSLLMYEGINFKNEQEFLKAINNIRIETIKTQLGEK
jgi:hypothetical protein